MVVEMAKALAAREDELDTKVHFVAYGAEEVGLVGSGYDAENRDFDSIEAIVLTELTVRLAGDEFEATRKDPEEIAQALEADDLAEGMKVIGDWPYDE